jgi:hypothetical protein
VPGGTNARSFRFLIPPSCLLRHQGARRAGVALVERQPGGAQAHNHQFLVWRLSRVCLAVSDTQFYTLVWLSDTITMWLSDNRVDTVKTLRNHTRETEHTHESVVVGYNYNHTTTTLSCVYLTCVFCLSRV